VTVLFTPILDASRLPKRGEGYERATLDLKETASPKPGFHHAKDVAAFANHLGGTLLIGAQETDGRIGEYKPLTEQTVTAIQAAFSQAVRDRCSPHPLFDFARFPLDGGVVLAVNVWPYIGQVVGVAVKNEKRQDGFGEDSYAFPIRVGIDATYLLPEQLPMFMLPEVRRFVILLRAIPRDTVISLVFNRRTGYPHRPAAKVIEVDELGNSVKFLEILEGGGPRPGIDKFVPLDKIETVYRTGPETWTVTVHPYE
jgi:hypothetical protein